MNLDCDYLTRFDQSVTSARPGKLRSALLEGKELRQTSGKATSFFDFEQKKLHKQFDASYAQGVARLSEKAPSQLPNLMDRAIPRTPLQGLAAKAAKIGLGGLVGYLIGSVYNNSKSNLIIHEEGHAFAAHAIYSNVHTTTSTISKYWFDKGDFWKWFNGQREGAPGNWTSFRFPHGPPELTHFGEHLTQAERSLFITAGGLGAELVLNTTMAGLGLLAIRRRQKALGVGLIAMSIAPFSGGHSYIRRTPELLHHWVSGNGGDPPALAKKIAEVMGISRVEAFKFLWYGYIFLPILILGLMAIALFRPVSAVPKECVLMRMLAEGKESPELQKILTEVELENAEQCKAMGKMNQDEKEQFIIKLSDRLLSKIKANKETNAIFKETRKTLEKELEQARPIDTSVKVKSAAALISLVAYQIRNLNLVQALAPIFYLLTGVFLFAQGICVIVDGVQTIKDLNNEKLSMQMKALSVARLALSVISLVGITALLFVPPLTPLAIPFFVGIVGLQVGLVAARYFQTRKEATQLTEKKEENQGPFSLRYWLRKTAVA